MNNSIVGKSCRLSIWAAAAVALAVLGSATICRAQTAAAAVSQDLQEIVKFTQAKMSDDVIVSYIKNSGKAYNLSADDMLYLNSQGVSQPVLSALLAAKPSAPAAPAPVVAPTPAPAAPAPTPPPAVPPMAAPAYAPPPGFSESFAAEPGLNAGLWTTQSGVLASLAAVRGASFISPYLAFGPAGMQMSGASVFRQMT